MASRHLKKFRVPVRAKFAMRPLCLPGPHTLIPNHTMASQAATKSAGPTGQAIRTPHVLRRVPGRKRHTFLAKNRRNAARADARKIRAALKRIEGVRLELVEAGGHLDGWDAAGQHRPTTNRATAHFLRRGGGAPGQTVRDTLQMARSHILIFMFVQRLRQRLRLPAS